MCFSKQDFLTSSSFTCQHNTSPLNMSASTQDAGFGAISYLLELKNTQKPPQAPLLAAVSWA